MRSFLFSLGFCLLGAFVAEASPVTILKEGAVQVLSPSGQVTKVTKGVVGSRYTLVEVQGSMVLLQDTGGTRYLVALKSTDCPPSISPVAVKNNVPNTIASTAMPDSKPSFIQPGALWLDDRGKHVQAHGGGIIKVGETYYWFGEDRSEDNPPGIPIVSCYTSDDLIHWKFRNQVEKAADPAGLGAGWILERPKVFYNDKTKKFVMYAHLDTKNYKYAHVAVFVCDTPDGNYEYVTNFRPLNQESRDIGQFIDDDGSAYLIFESRPTKGFFIAKLADDYLSVEKETCFIKAPLEGGGLVHYQGLYYVIGSKMSGWYPNPNKYATSPRLEGPWSEFTDIAPPDTKTYQSQSTFMMKVVGTKATSVLFMGDRWMNSDHPHRLADARYVWMPLEIGAGKLRLPQPEEWTIDLKTGETLLKP